MTRARRLLPWAGAAVALAAVAGVLAFAATRSGATAPAPAAPLAATATLTPRVALFGSVVTAEVRVVTDRRRVDPASVWVRARFGPYTLLGPPRRAQRGGEVRVDYRLQCVAPVCSRPGGQAAVALPPAVIFAGERREIVEWPPAAVASRLSAADLAPPRLQYPTDAPGAPYSRDPRVLGWTAVAASVVLLLGLAAAALGTRRRAPAEAAGPASEVERALDRIARARHQAERRSTVGQLAEALEHEGLPELAPLARRLAWSRRGPSAAVTSELSLLVRAALEMAP